MTTREELQLFLLDHPVVGVLGEEKTRPIQPSAKFQEELLRYVIDLQRKAFDEGWEAACYWPPSRVAALKAQK